MVTFLYLAMCLGAVLGFFAFNKFLDTLGSTPKVLHESKEPLTMKFKPVLSEPAKKLVEEYNSLPLDNRPFSDIEALVIALDEKTDYPKEWNPHFSRSSVYSGSVFTWKDRAPSCPHVKCKYAGYYSLHKAISVVKESLARKERAIKDAELAPTMDVIKELEERLRAEAKLNDEFVKDFKELN